MEAIKAHPFFGDIDWDKLLSKDPSIEPPFKPASSEDNPLGNFDKKMTAMKMTALGLSETAGGGGTLGHTQSRDPFADFGYDGVLEPEPEPEASSVAAPEVVDRTSHALADSIPPPIGDTSEVGVPPLVRSAADGTAGQGEGRTSPSTDAVVAPTAGGAGSGDADTVNALLTATI